jgi:protocatechuate 3,4-dioxygenase, alpha subunit
MQPTPSQTIGPFFHIALPSNETIGRLAGPGAEGEALTLICRVLDAEGAPVDDAMLELWQADASGVYNHPDDPRYADHDPACPGFARQATNAKGECVFHTVKPGSVTSDGGATQAPHINVAVFARGLLKRAVTRIYFEDDPANAQDSVLASVPEHRRTTLLANSDASAPALWRFDIHLAGPHETVFFAI